VFTQAGINGYTVSEFPIVYYVAAKMYSVFGFHESILRRLHFAIFIFGCASLLWLGLLLFKHSWLAFIPAVITFSSPYLYYYGLNFLPDVPALSLSFAGGYFITAYFFDKKLWKMYLAFALFCLACLLKISNGILFCSLVAAIVFLPELRTEKYFRAKHIVHFFFLTFLVVAVNGWWFYFVTIYNNTYGNHLNLTSIYPIWELNWIEILKTISAFWNSWTTVILHPLNWAIVLMSVMLWGAGKITTTEPMFSKVIVWSFIGVFCYTILWFHAFKVHDYYLVPLFIAIVCVFFFALIAIDQNYETCKKIVVPLAALVVVDSVIQTQTVMNYRYTQAQNCYYINEGCYTIEPYLRTLGVSRFDFVLSVPDPSPNVTLYYMNQPGYTECSNWYANNCGQLKNTNIRYAIVGDDKFLENREFVSSLDSLIGEYQGLKIFKIKRN
jgi:hypothetical protein